MREQLRRGRLAGMPGAVVADMVLQSLRRRVAVGPRVSIDLPSHLAGRCTIRTPARDSSLTIGRGARIGRSNTIEVGGRIGTHLLTAANVAIVGRHDHAIDIVGVPVSGTQWVGDRKVTEFDCVDIGDDVWIGFGAIILSGVAIGSGAIIAAGSVVVKDVLAGEIVAGNPARRVAYRFESQDALTAHLKALRIGAR